MDEWSPCQIWLSVEEEGEMYGDYQASSYTRGTLSKGGKDMQRRG